MILCKLSRCTPTADMSAPKFVLGDKIFAKVRGYPPWPARVEAVADETPNKVKYHVYFFGTNETAVCKQDKLFPYVENRAKYGKPMKKQVFNEALSQIDAELGLSPAVHPPQTPKKDTESEMENSYVVDTSLGKKSQSSSNTHVTVKRKGVWRRAESSDTEELATKQSKKSSVGLADQDAGEDSQESTPSKSRTVSKHGRKIKPKRFIDGSDTEVEENSTPKNKQGSKTPNQSAKSNQSGSKAQLQLDAEFLEDGILVAFTPKGEEVRLKLNLSKPDSIMREKAKLEWEATTLERAREIWEKVESGLLLPENVKKEIHEKYQSKLIEIETKMGLDDKKEKLEFLKTESRLLHLDSQIKRSLNLKQADPEAALKYMEDFQKFNIAPLMLKKHPELVGTIKRLTKYVGNTSSWDINEAFANKAACAKIRSKAKVLYNKIKSLFMVPSGESFCVFFAEEMEVFKESVKEMNVKSVYLLTKDPVNQQLDKKGGSKEEEEESGKNTSTSAA